jgi:hypothetical protein
MKMKKVTRGNIIVLLCSFIFVVIFLEIITRLICGTTVLNHSRNDSDYIQYDSTLGYVYTANKKAVIKNSDYGINISINSFGYRDSTWNFHGNKKRILVAGDSYTAGFGVDVHERWPNLLNDAINSQKQLYITYNIAVSGYSIGQICTSVKKMYPVIKPDYVIIGFCLQAIDRIIDPYLYYKGYSLRKSKIPYAAVYDGQLFLHHFKIPLLQKMEYPLLKNSVLYNYMTLMFDKLVNKIISQKSDHDKKLLTVAKKMILSLSSELNKQKIKLIVLPVIQHEKKGGFQENVIAGYNSVKSFCLGNNIGFADILPAFSKLVNAGKNLWVNNDSHWNLTAHKTAAGCLFEEYFKVEMPEEVPEK